MITHQQIVEQELTAKTLEILQLKIQLANFSNENEQLKEQVSKIQAATNQLNNPGIPTQGPVNSSPFAPRTNQAQLNTLDKK